MTLAQRGSHLEEGARASWVSKPAVPRGVHGTSPGMNSSSPWSSEWQLQAQGSEAAEFQDWVSLRESQSIWGAVMNLLLRAVLQQVQMAHTLQLHKYLFLSDFCSPGLAGLGGSYSSSEVWLCSGFVHPNPAKRVASSLSHAWAHTHTHTTHQSTPRHLHTCKHIHMHACLSVCPSVSLQPWFHLNKVKGRLPPQAFKCCYGKMIVF